MPSLLVEAEYRYEQPVLFSADTLEAITKELGLRGYTNVKISVKAEK